MDDGFGFWVFKGILSLLAFFLLAVIYGLKVVLEPIWDLVTGRNRL